MNKYLFDSDVLIDYFKKLSYATDIFDRLINDRSTIATSIVSISEIRAGWDDEQTEKLLPRLPTVFVIEDISLEVATLAGKLRREYLSKGIQLALIDVLIAATALVRGYTLITRNKKDFPMPSLKLYDF